MGQDIGIDGGHQMIINKILEPQNGTAIWTLGGFATADSGYFIGHYISYDVKGDIIPQGRFN